MKVKLKLLLAYSVSILLFAFIGLGIYSFFINKQYIQDSPYNVFVSDITPDSVTITWRTSNESNTYILIGDSDQIISDDQTSQNHSVKLTGLQSSSKYTFRISDGEREWVKIHKENSATQALNTFEFTTSKATDQITIPNTLEIDLQPNKKVLTYLKFGENTSTLISTQANRFGGAVVDKNAYLDNSFETFFPEEETELVILDILYSSDGNSEPIFSKYLNKLITPTYATDSVNCNQSVSTQSVNAISPNAFKDLADRWVANRGKNYAIECYNDVVYRAKAAGFDPAFALTIWLNESGASNYTQDPVNSGIIEDFGIHGNPNVSVEDFNAQINYFLKLKFEYSCEGLSYWEAWGNMYRWGSCNENDPVKRQQGIDYYKAIENVYSLVTNGRSLPDKINGYEKVDGGDDTPSWSSEGPLCCALKISNKSDLKGDFEDGQEGKTCEDVWKVGRSLYGGKLEYSVMIPDKTGGACEVDYPGVCCNTDGKTLWYPKAYCNNPLEGVDEKTCNAMNKISSYDVTLNGGINFIGLDYNPTKDAQPMTASQLLEEDSNLILIADFGTYEWKNIVKRGSDKPFVGQDFNLEQGKGYLVITNKALELKLEGWKNSNIEYSALNDGWNLVGGALYSSYKASGLIEKLSKEDITISTVANWNTDTGHFNYFKQEGEKVYGEDMRISSKEGLFIRR